MENVLEPVRRVNLNAVATAPVPYRVAASVECDGRLPIDDPLLEQ